MRGRWSPEEATAAGTAILEPSGAASVPEVSANALIGSTTSANFCAGVFMTSNIARCPIFCAASSEM